MDCIRRCTKCSTQRRSQDFFLGGGQFSVISGGRPGGGGSSRNFPGSP